MQHAGRSAVLAPVSVFGAPLDASANVGASDQAQADEACALVWRQLIATGSVDRTCWRLTWR